ncbi:MAG: TRAP transporter small permease subunit [Pseudomonadota bacterium]
MELKVEEDVLQAIKALGLRVFAIATIMLMCSIALQVLCNALDVNPIAEFGSAQFLVGEAITLNSLLDFQWHLLVIIGLLPVGLIWAMGRHVRVDFLYNRFSERSRARVNLAGNLIFAAPFFVLMLPASWSFMMRAWTSGEGSSSGGLNDLWLIKAVLPFGLGLLALAVLVETISLLRRVK